MIAQRAQLALFFLLDDRVSLSSMDRPPASRGGHRRLPSIDNDNWEDEKESAEKEKKRSKKSSRRRRRMAREEESSRYV